jgi:hypothetical protein
MKQRVLLAGINNPPNRRAPLNTGVASRKWEDLWLHLKLLAVVAVETRNYKKEVK